MKPELRDNLEALKIAIYYKDYRKKKKRNTVVHLKFNNYLRSNFMANNLDCTTYYSVHILLYVVMFPLGSHGNKVGVGE